MTSHDARRRLTDASERYYYYYPRDTERYRAECERHLSRRSRDTGVPAGHARVKDPAQRMAENGEALKYIELVLRQLQRASRDHRELVRQRHADFQREMSKRADARIRYHRDRHRDVGVGRDDDPTYYVSGTWSRSSSSPWQSDLTLRRSRPDVTTRLLTKRKDYGGTARNAPARVQESASAYHEMRYIPEAVGWQDARQTFGAWSLAEASSSNVVDRCRTSSTVV